jgi:hypothetical protein
MGRPPRYLIRLNHNPFELPLVSKEQVIELGKTHWYRTQNQFQGIQDQDPDKDLEHTLQTL